MNISITQCTNFDSTDFDSTNVHAETGNVTFDSCGNVYIEYEKKVYQVCINNKNDIYLDYADYSILSNNPIECGCIMEASRESNTKESLTDIIQPDNDQYDDSDEDEYQDENDPYGAVGDNYYIEEKDYMFSVPTSDYYTPQFYFCKLSGSNDIPVNDRNNGDVKALYDAFMYDENKCIFRSKLIGEPPLYVVKIYDNYINQRDIFDIHTSKSYKVVFDGKYISLIKF